MKGGAMLLLKTGAEIGGAVGSAIYGVTAVSDNTAITVTAITAVLGFAGLLVRQVTQNQRAIWEAYRVKEAEAELAKDETHYTHWEMDKLRWSHGERSNDPGPYVPRRPQQIIPAPQPPAGAT